MLIGSRIVVRGGNAKVEKVLTNAWGLVSSGTSAWGKLEGEKENGTATAGERACLADQMESLERQQ